jgi:sulfotransferase family protein
MAYGFEYRHENERAHLDFYRAHNASVHEAAAKHGVSDLLTEVCWERAHGWTELCALLGVHRLWRRFPHANRPKSNPTHWDITKERLGALMLQQAAIESH